MHEFDYRVCRVERLAEFGLDDVCCESCGNLHAELAQAGTQLPLLDTETITWFRFQCTGCGKDWLVYKRTIYLNGNNPHKHPRPCNTGVNPSFGHR